jgi:cell division protein FtsL
MPNTIKQKKTTATDDVDFTFLTPARARPSIFIFITIIFIFIGGLGTAFSFAYMDNARLRITDLTRDVQAARDLNMANLSIASPHYSLEDIERLARDKLGMIPPDPSRVTRINVPRPSYIVQNETRPYELEQNIWRSAWRYIRDWLRFN